MPITKAFEPRIPAPPGIPRLADRAAAVQALGWSPADAEWLALVCLHSGVFTRHQYRAWYHRDKHAASRFVRRVTDAGVAREHPLPDRNSPERFCHVFGRSLYRALGMEHAHHRRLGSTALLWRRLLTLDCLLAYPDGNWLATRAEKLQYFLDRGFDEEELPQRFRGDRAFHHATLNPIVGADYSVSFLFPDPGHGTDQALRYWASDHQLFWEELRIDGIEIEVIVSVRDDAAKDLYEKTLYSWTPAAFALNENERSFLQAIQETRWGPDPEELEKWLGRDEADRIEGWLRARQDGSVARIDRYTIHVAERLDTFRFDGAFLE